MQQTLKRQSGISFFGVLFFLALGALVLTVGLKLGPHYMEYATIRKVMNDLAQDASAPSSSRQEILKTLMSRLYINSVDAVERKDFAFKKISNGVELAVAYEVREHLFGNVDAVLSFSHGADFAVQ